MLLFVYTTTCKRFVIFTYRYFKLSWNTTPLSQSNFRKFSCSSITNLIYYIKNLTFNCIKEILSEVITGALSTHHIHNKHFKLSCILLHQCVGKESRRQEACLLTVICKKDWNKQILQNARNEISLIITAKSRKCMSCTF